MIYRRPEVNEPLDQADLIDACPLVDLKNYRLDAPAAAQANVSFRRVIVITQTCDLANAKTKFVNVAEVFQARQLVDNGTLKPADIKGPLRAGRIWGMYFLPASEVIGLNEMIVDLRGLHTVEINILTALCQNGQRIVRLQSPYREHLAKHFADSFSRIGLPQPYETL